MQIVTGRRGEPHVTSRQMQAVYRSFLGEFALLDIGEKLRAEAYSDDIVRVYDGVVSVQGIYAVIAYNQYDEVYIEPVSVGKKRIDTIVLHYTKDNALDVEDMQLDVVQGEEYTDNPIAPVVPEGGDAWEGTTDIQVPIYDVEVTNFGLTVTPYARMLTVIPTLDSIAERIPETVVTGVKGDSEVLYRDGDVNITKANIGLGNVDNTADTDKPISTATQTALNLKADLTYVDAKIAAAYHAGGSKTVAELTSALLIADNIGKVYNISDSGVTTSDFVEGAGKPINEGDNVGICNVGTEESPVYKFDLLSGFVDLSAYATTSAVNTGLAGKVDKVAGKGLSTEDYTTTEKTKLAGISEGATQTVANPADTATETLSKLEVGGVVYDVPQGASGATELSELTDVDLSNVEDNDILQYDETDNKWKNSNALQGTKTTNGNPITVTDAAPVNAVNLSMDLEPIQDLHGYANPWVGGAGKNKLPMTVDGIKSANTSGTWSGNTLTKNNGTFEILTDSDNNVIGIKANGLFNAITSFNLPSPTLPSGSYVLNGCPSGHSGNVAITLQNIGNDEGSGATFTLSTQTTPNMWIGVKSGYTANNLIFYPMIRLSTETDSSFAPYTNICPISGRSEEAIQRVGKNLWGGERLANDIKSVVSDATINTTNKTVSYVAGSVYEKVIPTTKYKENTRYTVILKLKNDQVNAHSNLMIVYTDGSYTSLNVGGTAGNTVVTFATVSDANKTIAYIQGTWRNGTTTLYYDECGIFEGVLTVDDFEPYKGKTYTIQIGQDVYGAHYDVTRGKMVVDKAIKEFNGESGESWGVYGSISGWFYYDNCLDGAYYNSEETNYITTNMYKQGVYTNVFNGECALGISGSAQRFVVRDTRYNTVADWKTYLVSNPLQVCYELATPFTIPLTPEQIELLENNNTIYADAGDITLTYQPNNAIGEAVRAVEESYDPEFAVRPVLKKKSFSGTTDSDGSVTLINASDIPSNHRIIPLHITDMTIGGNAGTYFVEYKPYNSGDSVKGYCYTYFNGSQITPVGSAVTGNFYYYELEG